MLYHKPSEAKAVIDLLKDKYTAKYYLRYTPNDVTVNLETMQDHKGFTEDLQTLNKHYHTYTSSEEKTHAFALRETKSRKTWKKHTS